MKQYLSIATSVLLGCGVVSASDFFYGGEYDGSILTFGIRAGFNTSNMADDDMGKLFNLDSWGTGFTGGVVAELHMRDWLVIQPGFFFESRSNNYSYVYDPKMFPNPESDLVELGHPSHAFQAARDVLHKNASGRLLDLERRPRTGLQLRHSRPPMVFQSHERTGGRTADKLLR